MLNRILPIRWVVLDGPLETAQVVWRGDDMREAEKVAAKLNRINARSRGAYGGGRYFVEAVW